MAHRRKKTLKRDEKRQKEEEALRAAKRKRQKKIIGAVVALSLLSGLIYLVINIGPPKPDWVTCEPAGTIQQQKHFRLYIQIGEKAGELNVSFIRIPEGLGIKQFCRYPIITYAAVGDERDNKYVKIHVEAQNTHAYTLGEFFTSWSRWQDYPRDIYFSADGVSYYRTQNMEMLVGQTRDPTQRSYAYGSYVPQAGDYIDLIAHEPLETVPGPYPGGQLPIDADFTRVPAADNFKTWTFSASASGGTAPYTFEWDFGDGSPNVLGQTVVHTYAFAGSYPAVLSVKDAAGTLVTVTHYVPVS